MTYKITHKNSTVAGTPPVAGDIDVGEIAINAADATLYVKDTNGSIKNIVTDAPFTQAGTGAVQRTVESKLRDVVSVKDFGAVGDGVTDDTNKILAASNTGKYVYFPEGTYLINSALTPTSLKWISDNNAVVKLGASANITCSSIDVKLQGITFEENPAGAIYTTGVTSSAITTAFGTPTYPEGSDFTATLASSTLTLSLAALSGDITRSILSNYITLDSSKKYVVNVKSGSIVSSYKNFQRLAILRYDSSNNLLGEWEPQGTGVETYLENAAKIKIRIYLKRTVKSPSNLSTVIDLDKLELFEVTTAGAVPAAGTKFVIGNCSDVIIKDCVFNNIKRDPWNLALVSRATIEGNKLFRCGGSVHAGTNCSDVVIKNNYVDMRQPHSNGSLYNIKHYRVRCVGGSNSSNVIVDNNTFVGAHWAVEIINQVGVKSQISNNVIQAEQAGISIPHGKNSVITGNTIEIANGYPFYGIEIPGAHIDVVVSNNTVYLGKTLVSTSLGISASATAGWTGGVVSNNTVKAPIGFQFATAESSDFQTVINIYSNSIDFNCWGVFMQKIGAIVADNNFTYSGNSIYTGVSGIYNVCVNTQGGQSINIVNNKLSSGPEGIVYAGNSTGSIIGNTCFANVTYPSLFYWDNSSSYSATANTFLGSTPTAYFIKPGSGSVSTGVNTTTNGRPILLASNSRAYPITASVTSTSSAPITHTTTFSLPEFGILLVDIRTKVGGDNNHRVSGLYVAHWQTGSANNINTISVLGSVVASSGSILVNSGSLAVSLSAGGTVTAVLTQIAGSQQTSEWYITVTKLSASSS
jgi:hypothetical protein